MRNGKARRTNVSREPQPGAKCEQQLELECWWSSLISSSSVCWAQPELLLLLDCVANAGIPSQLVRCFLRLCSRWAWAPHLICFWLVQIILDSSIVLHHPLCPVCPPEGGVTFKQEGVGGWSAVTVKQDGGSRNWWALTCLYLTFAHFDLKAAFQKISISSLDQQSRSAPDKISLSQIVLHV